MKGLSFVQRLNHAKAGLVVAWHREQSFRSQLVLATAAVGAAVVLRPQLIWWAALVLAIALVFVAEIINSSIEALADHLHPSQHPSIKAAKDMAAAAVLLASLAAVAIGALLALYVL
jgi:undecaprenol kinase